MTITQSSTRLVALVAGVSIALTLIVGVFATAAPARAAALTSAQVQAIVSLLQSFGADATTIANVQASLNGQATSGTGSTGTTGGACPALSRSLQSGSTGADVMALQKFLNSNAATQVSVSGAGSPGLETTFFGPATMAAVEKFQTLNNVSSIGIVGPATRAAIAAVCGSSNPGNPGVPVTGNGLKVVLSPLSPNNTVLVQGQGIGDLADFTFVNPTNASIVVTNLSFKRIGVSNDQTIDNVYLYNGVTRITDSAGVSNSAFSFNVPGGIFTVAPGGTYTVSVRADIDKTNTSGQQLGVQLVSVGASGTLDTSTSFPINSFTQSISNATLATVDFSLSANTIPAATTISPQSSFTLWQNTVSVSQNPVWLKSMHFTNLGSADNTAVSNLQLFVDGVQVGGAVPSMNADRTVTFDLSASPVSLSTQSHVIKVLGDIVGGASRTVQLSLQRSSDALVVDSQLGQPITPTVAGLNFVAVSAGVVTVQSTGGAGGGVSVNKDPASAINNVSVGATNQNLASFDFLASGEPTKVQDLFVCAVTSVHNGGLDNGKIFFNGVQVGSTKDIVDCTATPTGTDFNLGSSLILPAGQNAVVSVYADAKTSTSTNLSNNETVQIKLVAGSSNAQGQSSLTSTSVPGSPVPGNVVSITNTTLTASKFSGYANQTMIPGTQGAILGSFTLSAGSNEAVNVNTITIAASTTAAAEITNLSLKDSSGNAIGTVIPTPSTNNSFSVSLNIPLSGTVTVNVFGNILNSANSSIQLGLPTNGVTGTGVTTGLTSTAAPVMLQTISVGSGTLAAGTGASNPVSANVIAGSVSPVKVGSFTFSAQNSPFTVQKLEVDVPNASAAAISTLSIQFKDTNGVVQTVSQGLQAGASTSSALFSGLQYAVPANDSSDVSVWVTTPTIASGGSAISGVKIVAALNHLLNFQAVDQSGNATTTPYAWTVDASSNSVANQGTLVVRKSIPTFANQALGTIPAAGQALYRFTVTADAAGAVDLDQISFNVSTSTAVLTGFTLYDVTSGTAVALNASAVNTITNGVVKIPFDSLQQVGAGSSKTYELRSATLASWSSGASISISLAQDSASVANAAATSLTGGNNIVWSDRSATNHSTLGTAATDWTNGYLLKDFVNDVTSFNHS